MAIHTILKFISAKFHKILVEIISKCNKLFLAINIKNYISNMNCLKLLATILRIINFCLIELKENKSTINDLDFIKLNESLLLKIFKFLFIGNSIYSENIFGKKYQFDSDK